MNDPLIELLRKSSLFTDLDDSALQTLALRCRRRTYPANTALFHEDDPGQTMYLIVNGRVAIERVQAMAGETIHLAERGPGEHFGEMALLDGAPRSADAVTRTDCELLMLDRTEFLACLAQSPALALAIIRSLLGRLRSTNDALVALRTQDVLGRLALFLLEESLHSGTTGAAARKWTQQQIADRIGTTKESVNRALARLKKTGAIRQSPEHGIAVADEAKLRRAAGL
ncbi:MAG: Crp/Fnr family transcriptional regulator [Cytophagales bacterium]|nr:Crp/Fnr family transcriptional regulator [Armatimonadota bacterium]